MLDNLSGNRINKDPSISTPTAVEQVIVWGRLGIQSFGGGTATLTLIRRAVVDQQQWVSGEEFARYWALVLMVPGINLLGLTVLIGKKAGGYKGIALALVGLLFPSVTITILLTALYARLQHSHVVITALSGVIPATVGVGIYTGWQIALPVLINCRSLGTQSLIVALLLFIGSAVLEATVHWPVVVILLTSGAIGAITGFAGVPKIESRS